MLPRSQSEIAATLLGHTSADHVEVPFLLMFEYIIIIVSLFGVYEFENNSPQVPS